MSNEGHTFSEAMELIYQEIEYGYEFENGSYHPNELNVLEAKNQNLK